VLLDVEDIHTYYGQSHVLTGSASAVNERRSYRVLGAVTVRGKTTTLRSIADSHPQRGIVRFQGVTISGERTYRVARRGIAYVPETRDPFLYLLGRGEPPARRKETLGVLL